MSKFCNRLLPSSTDDGDEDLPLIHWSLNMIAVLQTEGKAPSRYFEVDFPEVTARKAAIMHKIEPIASLLANDTKVRPGRVPHQ